MKEPQQQEDKPGSAELGEYAIVIASCAQGALVGAWLAIAPAMALRLGGFPAAPAFFVRWAGALQLVLAAGYALEWTRFRRVTLLVLAKGATAAFLAAVWTLDGVPPLMMAATFLEGAFALTAAMLKRPAEQSRRARARLRLVAAPPAEIRPAGRR